LRAKRHHQLQRRAIDEQLVAEWLSASLHADAKSTERCLIPCVTGSRGEAANHSRKLPDGGVWTARVTADLERCAEPASVPATAMQGKSARGVHGVRQRAERARRKDVQINVQKPRTVDFECLLAVLAHCTSHRFTHMHLMWRA
jgi:hypothetical protein